MVRITRLIIISLQCLGVGGVSIIGALCLVNPLQSILMLVAFFFFGCAEIAGLFALISTYSLTNQQDESGSLSKKP
jgi:hypothetical protein